MYPKLKVPASLLLLIFIIFALFKSYYLLEIGVIAALTLSLLIYYFRWRGLLYFTLPILVFFLTKLLAQKLPLSSPTTDVIIRSVFITCLFMILFSVADNWKINKKRSKDKQQKKT